MYVSTRHNLDYRELKNAEGEPWLGDSTRALWLEALTGRARERSRSLRAIYIGMAPFCADYLVDVADVHDGFSARLWGQGAQCAKAPHICPIERMRGAID